MKILIPLNTYETLCGRLTQHHKAHKGLSDFSTIRAGLERNARITPDGVEVDLARLKISADAVRDNVKFVGAKYATAADKMVLLDIEEAIAEHEARSLHAEASVGHETPDAAVYPVQAWQPLATESSHEPKEHYEHCQPLPAKPYAASGSRVGQRINEGLNHPSAENGPTLNVPKTDRRDLPDLPEGHEWWADGSGGFTAMPMMAELPDVY